MKYYNMNFIFILYCKVYYYLKKEIIANFQTINKKELFN